MITIEQCRAARGLVGWTQQDLADACGLSKTAINNFEKGHSDIKAESLRAIRMAFESTHIEFIGTHGLKQSTDQAKILSGESALADLFDDIYNSLRGQNDEELLVLKTNQAGPEMNAERLVANNIKTRALFSHKTAYEELEQRHLPATSQATISASYYVYANKFAIELWDQSMIILVTSPDGSHSQKEMFERLWAQATTSSQTEGDAEQQNIQA